MPIRFRRLQLVRDVNSLENQDAAFRLHFTDGLRSQATPASIYSTRLQRAPEGSRQSAARGGDDVIQRRGVRLRNLGAYTVVDGYGAVDAEVYRLLLGRKVRQPRRPLDTLNFDPRDVGDIPHGLVSPVDEWAGPTRDLPSSLARATDKNHSDGPPVAAPSLKAPRVVGLDRAIPAAKTRTANSPPSTAPKIIG